MSNLAVTLKQEICRLARREIKAQTVTTRRAAAQHRRDIARLKRLLQLQEKKIRLLQAGLGKQAGRPSDTDDASEASRFSARSVRAQRRRLKLSAAEYGQLIGVSAQTVYNWELGKARPKRAQFAALVAARGIGRREALSRLQRRGK